MVAYSFKKRFVQPIRVGLSRVSLSFDCPPKRQTIRAHRKRHARPGETLQLYCGMRTKQCFKIGEAQCTGLLEIYIAIGSQLRVAIDGGWLDYAQVYDLARSDGFVNSADMLDFWQTEHDGPAFEGVLITWEPT